MPRAGRVLLEGGIYHVYNRVLRGDDVFANDDEASAFVRLLHEVKERDGLVVFGWCLMSNHYHLAVRTGAVPISRSMKSLQQRVTRGFNERRRTFGPLWQGRYRAKLVVDEQYLYGLLAYIHLNPVSALMASDPAEYRWSGHQEILGRVRQPITDVDEVLVLFGEKRRAARQAYLRAIKGTVAEPWVGEGPGRLPWWKLGRPTTEDDEAPTSDSSIESTYELGRRTGLGRPSIATVDFVDVCVAHLGVPLEELAGRGRTPHVVRAREMMATLGVERYGLRVKDIAGELKKSSEAGTRMVSRGSEKRQKEECFRREFEALDRHIAGTMKGHK